MPIFETNLLCMYQAVIEEGRLKEITHPTSFKIKTLVYFILNSQSRANNSRNTTSSLKRRTTRKQRTRKKRVKWNFTSCQTLPLSSCQKQFALDQEGRSLCHTEPFYCIKVGFSLALEYSIQEKLFYTGA